jgi:hypothetical protein
MPEVPPEVAHSPQPPPLLQHRKYQNYHNHQIALTTTGTGTTTIPPYATHARSIKSTTVTRYVTFAKSFETPL